MSQMNTPAPKARLKNKRASGISRSAISEDMTDGCQITGWTLVCLHAGGTYGRGALKVWDKTSNRPVMMPLTLSILPKTDAIECRAM